MIRVLGRSKMPLGASSEPQYMDYWTFRSLRRGRRGLCGLSRASVNFRKLTTARRFGEASYSSRHRITRELTYDLTYYPRGGEFRWRSSVEKTTPCSSQPGSLGWNFRRQNVGKHGYL